LVISKFIFVEQQHTHLSFCGFRGKHRPAISIAGIFYSIVNIFPGLSLQMVQIKKTSRKGSFNILKPATDCI
jgi:hypothetical protein